MPLLYNKKILFIHIPKCAGCSIKKLLEDRIVLYESRNRKDALVSLQHYTIKQLIEEKLIKDLQDYFILSSVRHPYDRISSHILTTDARMSGYEQFTKDIYEKHKQKKLLYWRDNHLLPMNEFLYYNGKQYGDFILKVENIKRDADFITKKFNLTKKIEYLNKGRYSKLTKSGKPQTGTNMFSADCKKMLNEIYQRDFELFDYEME